MMLFAGYCWFGRPTQDLACVKGRRILVRLKYRRPTPRCSNRVGVRVSSKLARMVCALVFWGVAGDSPQANPLALGE